MRTAVAAPGGGPDRQALLADIATLIDARERTAPILGVDILERMFSGPFETPFGNALWRTVVGKLSAFEAGFVSACISQLEKGH